MTDIASQLAALSPEKRELLEMLLRERGVEVSRALIIPQRRETNACPLSSAQQRLWFLDQLEPGSPLYNIPSAVRLTGSLDVAALAQSLNQVVRRHESLRTTFTTVGEQPVQVIAPELTLPLQVIDLTAMPETEREAEVLRQAMEEAQCPFDLTRGPLLRAILLCLGAQEYVALLTMHHIVSDGWSMGVLIREMAIFYNVFLTSQLSLLPELSIQYVDYALWQRQWLQGETLAEQISYWKRRLDGTLAVLQLPTDRPRSAMQTSRGESYTFTLPKSLAKALNDLSRQEKATLFMALLAAFQTLLYRYTGQKDISVGTPIANRSRGELERLIGFFVNTLVMRTDLSGEPGFRELLGRVREAAMGAYAHQDVPFETLVEELRPERDMSHTPLFQVMFVLQNMPMQTQRLPSLTFSPMQVHSGTAKFDLTLLLAEEADRFGGALEYNADMFDAATIRRMLGHFQTLLEGIAADPDRPISTLPLMTVMERQQLLADWNDTGADYPRELCLDRIFEMQVEQTPDVVALVLKRQNLTYRELNQRANQLARRLQKLGVGPEVPVGIYMERSLELIVGVLGILKAGGIYVPFDPTYPSQRVAFMMQDTRVPVLLTQCRLLEQLPVRHNAESTARMLCLDSDWPDVAIERPENPNRETTARNLAYILYTSGSTGRPKGVCCCHAGVANLLTDFESRQPLAVGDGSSWWTSLNFDVSVYEIFTPLSTGGALHIVPETVRADGLRFMDWLNAHRIRSAYIPPFMITDLAAWLRRESETLNMRRLLVGVEPIHEQLLAEINNRVPSLHILNGYGPTEATVCCTLYSLQPQNAQNRNTPIGKAMRNAQIYLLDARLQPVPVGVPGEVYIGGEGLARGYLNRPELTAAQFIPDPFGAQAGARLYKTGDLARYLRDGNIEFIGRTDYQVKVRGYRIELGEIEAVLAQHPAVRKSMALVWKAEPTESERGPSHKDVRVVAYVVPTPESALTTSELREFARLRLPDYMLPSAFILLDALPLTPSGKVDRRALPAPEAEIRSELGTAFVAPCTPVEEVLAGIWAQLLKVEKVGVHDSFFELGGHSLLATRIVSRVRETLQVELPLRILFETPNVAGLAQRVEAARREAQGLSAPPIEPVPRKGDLPLSFAQQRLWFLDQLEPGSLLYNISDVVRINGPLDVAALEKSLNEIVRRHEILRTTFPMVDGKAVQVIAPELRLPLQIIGLEHLPQDERQTGAYRLAIKEAQRPFDLAQGPMLRVVLLRLNTACPEHSQSEEHLALLTMHHIVSDGWSTGVLIREMAMLYAAFSTGRPSPLPELPIQYADFACWQQRWLQGEVLEAQLGYWKRQLGGSPPRLKLPTDRPRPAIQSSRGEHQTFLLPEDLSRSLKDLGQQEGITLFMTLLAAFQTLLCCYTGQVDISVGTPIANRNRAEIEGLIGFFVNTLVMRTDLSGEPSFRGVLGRVREVALGAYAHQDLPFEMLVDALQPERDLSHTPLFQVMFILQNAPMEALELPDLTLSQVEIDTGVAVFDLTLAMSEGPNGLHGALEYNVDLFDAATAQRMVRHFQTLLEGIAADPDRRLFDLPLLTEAERQQLLVEWNATQARYPQDVCLFQLFEAQAVWTPDAVAVVLPSPDGEGRQQLTYRALNRRANRLAHYLQKLGVGAGTLTGLCVERSLDMVVGLLGVLKAGGAYLPLDPAYPQERLAFMLQDAQISVLVTQMHLIVQFEEPGITHHASRRLVCLDADWQAISRESDENPASDVTADDLAYVIYTSGSTGKPKGVLVSHRSVVNHNVAVVDHFCLRPDDRVLQFATINFDAAVEELFPTWFTGAVVVLRPGEVLIAGDELLRLVREESLTVLDLPTAYWHEWVYELSLSSEPLPASLRLVIVGGDKASSERLATWQAVGGAGVSWMNTYGPTEGTIIAALHQAALNDGEWDSGAEVPIGRPIANARLYVLDRYSQLVAAGAPGELHIGGLGVAQGYLDRPGLTAERFVPDPFGDDSGARLYKTGDLVRYRCDGNIEFLGRVDHQVKMRGFRVEPGEIETVLAQHAAVRQGAVLALEDDAGNKRLVAYVVPEEKEASALQQAQARLTGELRGFLKARLPEYMLPSAFVVLETLPLTPSGKVDRRALPAPDQTRPELASAYLAPRTPEEEILAGVWMQVLGVERVGVHDNFFELGGDSILSIQVVARANQTGLHLTPRQLFEHPTVAGLAAVAGKGRAIQAKQGLVTGPVLLTPIQRWFFEQDLPEPHHWNQALLLAVQKALEPAWLEAAVGHLQAHHDALRLRFERGEDGWAQTNAGLDGDVPFAWLDLSAVPEREHKAAIETHSAELQASLDLTAGPLLRLAYFDLGAGQPGRLLIVVHHLAMDGVSWRILLEDLQATYLQLSRWQAVRLPPKTTSFQHWARRLAAYAQTETVRQELAYWLSLSQNGIARLPVDYPGEANTEASARSVTVSLSPEETQALLQEVPAAYRTEINDALLTALVQAVARWTGARTLLVELEGHGREDILPDMDVSRTVGWFTTIYPVALDLEDADGPGEALQVVKEQLRRLPGRGIGYGLLRYLSQDDKAVASLRALPQPEVSFNYLGQFGQALPQASPFGPAPESRGADRSLRGWRSHLLEINGGIARGRLQLEWTYSQNLHRRATIERLAQDYIEALRALIAHCQSPEAGGYTASDFPLAGLDQKKLDKVLARINQPKGKSPR